MHDSDVSGDSLFEAVYHELKTTASRILRGEAAAHSFQTTSLVHDAYIRLLVRKDLTFRGKSHFLALAALAMRRILIDHARRRSVRRRVALRMFPENLGPVELARTEPDHLLALDEAISGLAERDPDAAQVVHLRFYMGMQIEEIATLLGCSPRTVRNRWYFARAWLSRFLAA